MNNTRWYIKLDGTHIVDEAIGKKAKYLNRLIQGGFPVPKTYVITKNVFWEVIRLNDVEVQFKALLNGDRFKNWYKIKCIIMGLNMPNEVKNVFDDIIEKLGWPIAIRSSAIDEDGDINSKAGIYKSVTDCESILKLEESVKLCWLSAFTPLAVKFGGGYSPIPLIFQESLILHYSGVAFSKNPLNNDDSEIVVCGVINGGDGIVSGEKTGSQRVFRKPNLDLEISKSKGEFCEDSSKVIAKVTFNIEQFFSFNVDIEWGICNGKIFILQTRPVTKAINKYEINTMQAYNLDDDEIFRVNIDQLEELHENWLKNKLYFRKCAIKERIRIPLGKYLRYNPEEILENELNRLLKDLKTKFLILDRNSTDRSIVIRKNQILDVLKSQKPSDDGMVTIRIREVPSFQMSGHSTRLEDGRILIESFPGTFNSILKTELVPGYYIVNNNGKVIEKCIKTYDKCNKLDYSQVDFIDCEEVDLDSSISNHYIKEITRITNIMSQYINEGRFEWTIDDEGLFLFDFSVENQSIKLTDNNINILSQGDFMGEIYKIEDTSFIKNVCSLHTVSVIPEREFFEVQKSTEIKNLITELTHNISKPIIVTRQPIAELALISQFVSGFIFEEGSLLCHLGIILREMKIPAIFVEGALKKFKAGTSVICVNREISFI